MEALLKGVVAGYAIAIPVGAVAILLIETAIHQGSVTAAAGALGAASADLIYAALAALFGAAAAEALEPIQDELKVVAAAILLGIAIRMFFKARKGPQQKLEEPAPHRAYLTFLGITLLNPATISYFVALVIGLDLGSSSRLLFVLGVGAASASWQLFLVAMAGALGARLTDRGRMITSVVGSLIVAGLAVYTLVG
jgi:threonine/homoserine/homoserine lactone efflux protein